MLLPASCAFCLGFASGRWKREGRVKELSEQGGMVRTSFGRTDRAAARQIKVS